jgi:hypothetical protein
MPTAFFATDLGNREQGTGNREQGTGNREQGTGNREQGTGNREQGTGNREQGTGNYTHNPLNRVNYLTAYITSLFKIPSAPIQKDFSQNKKRCHYD